ncbi:MAG: hypothetical protein HYS58_03895, partial [Elusimicrobia bacterium]|nr:hypothetical protein [Elusimicrobiota bacterium]
MPNRGLLVAILGFVTGLFEVIFAQLFAEGGLSLSIHGMIAVAAFVVGLVGFLWSIFDEVSKQAREVTRCSSSILSQYDQIGRTFMVYPRFQTLIGYHFDLLKQLYDVGQVYQGDEKLKNLFERYIS